MPQWVQWAEMIGRLTMSVVQWVASLIEAGKTPEEAEEIVRTEIDDRRAEIAARRAANDEALRRKHGRTSTADLTETEIAVARANGHLLVAEDGTGTVPTAWLTAWRVRSGS